MTQRSRFTSIHKTPFWVTLFLAGVLGSRIVLMVFAPHCDPSESRYAEMGRKMVETGNWVTPQFSYGVPFWAKPPLSMWMSAMGMEIFGVNEFGSRIVIFLAALGLLGLTGYAARNEFRSSKAGFTAAALLVACPLFFYCSAAVMTDLPLLLGTTLAMVGFRLALTRGSQMWGYLFFGGIVTGLLAKGPLVLVIAGPPIFVCCMLTRQWRQVWTRIPWISGSLLMLLLALPWYVLAEKQTPGFLDYFIIGEHIRRFTITKWAGDLYGKAHSEHPGMIWFYAIMAAFPWCLGFLALPFRKWRSFSAWAMADDARGLYLLLWALWPLAFFTPARNIIATYPLPSLPAIALLLTEICWRRDQQEVRGKFHPLHPLLVSASIIIILWAMAVSLVFPLSAPKQSERELVRTYQERRAQEDALLYYHDRKFSAEFYTGGTAENTGSLKDLQARLDRPGRLFLATQPKYFAALPELLRAHLVPVGTWGHRSSLYMERTDTPEMAGIDPSHTMPIGN